MAREEWMVAKYEAAIEESRAEPLGDSSVDIEESQVVRVLQSL